MTRNLLFILRSEKLQRCQNFDIDRKNEYRDLETNAREKELAERASFWFHS